MNPFEHMFDTDYQEKRELAAVREVGGKMFAEATEDLKKGWGVTVFIDKDGTLKVRGTTKED